MVRDWTVWAEMNTYTYTHNTHRNAFTLGVHFKNGTGDRKDDAYMREIDAIIDDGDLASGSFRKLAPRRYYFVVAE